MHEVCWKRPQRLSQGVGDILDILSRQNRLHDATIYLFSDHPMSLYEHGQICERRGGVPALLAAQDAVLVHRIQLQHSDELAQLPELLFRDGRSPRNRRGEGSRSRTAA